jgi:carbamoyl-phosphate synthase large subunit
MTGGGAPGAAGIIRCLKMDARIRLVVGDANPEAVGRYLNDAFVVLPSASEPNFIDELLRIALEQGVDIIFPLVTRELFRLATEKERFLEHGIRVIVSDAKNLHIANNKSALVAHLHQHNIVVPTHAIVHSIEELETAVHALGYPKVNVAIKPSISNGSRGVRILSEKIDEYDLMMNYKPSNLYSTLEKTRTIFQGRDFPEFLVSEYLPGDEFTIDTLVYDGEPYCIVPRRRLKMVEGISVKGVFEKNEEIIAYATSILRSLRLHGPIGIQVKQAEDGTFKVLEINPRIQGTSVSALGAGINLPLAAVLQEYEQQPMELDEPKWGVSFTRYYMEVFH